MTFFPPDLSLAKLSASSKVYFFPRDDHSDTAHEAREYGIGNVADILANADESEEHLKQATENAGKRHGK